MSTDPILAALLRIEQLLIAILELQAADSLADDDADSPVYLNASSRK